MRALLFCAIVLGVSGHLTASAQSPDAEASGPGENFFGVYVAPIYVAAVGASQPDVFPFTAEGQRAHDAYDVFAVAPNQVDDCADFLLDSECNSATVRHVAPRPHKGPGLPPGGIARASPSRLVYN